jgi:hypothetical protein
MDRLLGKHASKNKFRTARTDEGSANDEEANAALAYGDEPIPSSQVTSTQTSEKAPTQDRELSLLNDDDFWREEPVNNAIDGRIDGNSALKSDARQPTVVRLTPLSQQSPGKGAVTLKPRNVAKPGSDYALSMITVPEPMRLQRRTEVLSTETPVPNRLKAVKNRVVRTFRAKHQDAIEDLNADGIQEHIIMSPADSRGLRDISVIINGKELFYGRGTKALELPTRHDGWPDLLLKTGTSKDLVYEYNSALQLYEPKYQ